MTNVTISAQCQDDPNLEFIKEFNLAFARCDTDYILRCFAADARWEMVGAQAWQGIDAIAAALKTMHDGEALELIMDTIISSSNMCAASGVLKYAGGRDIAYCDLYTFSDAGDKKIKTLQAYAVETLA